MVGLFFQSDDILQDLVTLVAWFLVTNILTKVAQMFIDFFDYFERISFQVKTVWSTFWRDWATFKTESGHTGYEFDI